MSMVSAQEREFDVVVWGATGFAGRLTAQYLLERYGTSLCWALGDALLERLLQNAGVTAEIEDRSLARVPGERVTLLSAVVPSRISSTR